MATTSDVNMPMINTSSQSMDEAVIERFEKYGPVAHVKTGNEFRLNLGRELRVHSQDIDKFYSALQRLVDQGRIQKRILTDTPDRVSVDSVEYRLVWMPFEPKAHAI